MYKYPENKWHNKYQGNMCNYLIIKDTTSVLRDKQIMPILLLLLGYYISLVCIICQTSNMKTVLKKTSIDTTKQTLILALDYFEK